MAILNLPHSLSFSGMWPPWQSTPLWCGWNPETPPTLVRKNMYRVSHQVRWCWSNKYNMLAKLSSSGSTCKWSGLVMFCSLQEKENAGHEKKWQDMKRNDKEKKWKTWKKMKKQNSFFSLFCLLFFISWVSRKWDNLHLVFDWENVSWDHCFFSFCYFLWQNIQKAKYLRNTCFFFQKKRKSQTCWTCVSGAMCCGKIWDCLRVASVVKTKSVLIGDSLNRLNRMK